MKRDTSVKPKPEKVDEQPAPTPPQPLATAPSETCRCCGRCKAARNAEPERTS